MAKIYYKIFRSIEDAPDYYHSEPDFPTNLESIGDIRSNKRFIESWNSDVHWSEVKGKIKGYIDKQDPFRVIQFEICTFQKDVEKSPEVYGFNVIVRCQEFQLDVDKSLRQLAKQGDLSIYKWEWRRID